MWEPSFDAKDECNKHFLSNDNNQSFYSADENNEENEDKKENIINKV
jgi:hypothetical protein